MSLATWTPAALSHERRPLAGACWRVVESQHRVSTMKLVDTLEEQGVLEEVLEPTKPPVPPECQHLDFLLYTPFRYGAPYPGGSRFRRAGITPGVFYASESAETAVAEICFHRLLFFADAPGVPWPVNAGEYSVFSASYRTRVGLDLGAPPLARDRKLWMRRTDYEACQTLAERAREAKVEVLRYASVRAEAAGGAGMNLALLTCRVFASRAPHARQTWRLLFGPSGVRAICERPRGRVQFDRAAFADDPRIAALVWER
jgi:hypothetical protein